ncbi:MAG: hypothetical protein J6O40_04195, partial [Ruminococcus sp.]|nr:hypothetical protein [Ruminococcus sp.]
MKKTISKRIASFLAAAALTVTTVSSSFVKPLSAKAVNYWNYLVTVYDSDGSTQKVLDNEPASNYYALAMLTEKGTKFEHTADNRGWANVKGWAIQQFHPENKDSYSWVGIYDSTTDFISFSNFYYFGTDGSTRGGTFVVDTDKYDVNVRVYRTLGTDITLSTYADCIDPEKATDTIPGYKFGGDSGHYTDWQNVSKASIIKNITTYDVLFETEGNVSVNDSDNIFLRVKVEHKSGNPTYYVKQLTNSDIAAGKIEVQTADKAEWVDQGGTLHPNERMTGNEPSVVAELVKVFGSTNVSEITQLNHVAEIAAGEKVGGLTVVSYSNNEASDKDGITKMSSVIKLKAEETTDDYDFMSLLGNGLYYGITADRFMHNNHAQTNLAVNYYESNGQAIEPDLSGDFGGHFYISNFVDFNGKTVVDKDTVYYKDNQDPDGKIFIGSSHTKDGSVLHADSTERIKDKRDFVAIVVDTPANMTNNVIEPVINEMERTSANLLKHQADVMAQLESRTSDVYIDTRAFPDNTTIYVDGDALAKLMNGQISNGNLRFNVKENQMIVINFKDTEDVTVGEYKVNVYKADGTVESGDTETVESGDTKPNSTPQSDQNNWLNSTITRHIAWNLNSAKHITLNNTAGIFLIPQEDSTTYITGSSSGWLISDGYVQNNAEWHYLYDGLPASTADFSVSKSDITGEAEIEGAMLKIIGEDGKVYQSWVSEKNESGVTQRTFKLAPGKYKLVETGFDADVADKEYKVINSEVSFEVAEQTATASNGQTYKTAKAVISDTANKDAFTVDADNGYFKKVNENTIRVCDAEAVQTDTTKVLISKKEIGGEAELKGAELTIFNEKGAVVEKWTSGDKAKEITLENGTYTLKETGDEFKIGDKTYKVTESTVTFTVENGKVTSSKVDDKKDGAEIAVDAAKKVITISDAYTMPTTVTISKTEIGGEAELKGAELTIFDDKGAVVEKWTSGDKAKEVTLENGTYTLKETGKEFKIGDKTYKVTESTVTFTVENGKVTSSKVDDKKDGAKVTADNEKKIITISDAYTMPTTVTISKQEIGGSAELKGAELTIFDDKGAVVEKWTSGDKAKEITLENGTYTLKETGGEFTVGDKTYKVTDSTITFTVENGKVIDHKITDGTVGKVVIDGTNITVEDASTDDTVVTISKKEIGGSDELAGAELTITDDKGKVVEKWTSGKIAKNVTLKDGTYTLKETGNEFTVGDKTYKVTDSTVTFTVKDGKVTES